MNLENLVRSNIKKLKPYSSARAEFTGMAEVYLDANENPFPTEINRYPDPQQNALKSALAQRIGVADSQIIIGNGSDELIDIAIRVFCNPGKDIVRIMRPSFGMYEVAARINDARVEYADLDDRFNLVEEACVQGQSESHKILFLCSPNNPTGNAMKRETLIRVIKGWHGIVVLDEAYMDFADQPSLSPMVNQHPNLMILKTFSKSMGAAGLRIGYGVGSSEVISLLHRIRAPYNIGSVVQKVAMDVINDQHTNEKQIRTIVEQRRVLERDLNGIKVVEHIFPSDANFLLVRFTRAQRIKSYLEEKGIVVRDRSGLKGCNECLRITVGTPEENSRLIRTLKSYVP